jgi:thiamine biosynthesis lipoprotein
MAAAVNRRYSIFHAAAAGFRVLVFLFPAALYLSCAPPPPAQREFVMGTVCSINLFEAGTREAYNAVFAELRRIQEMAAFVPASGGGDAAVLDRINRNAGIQAAAAPEELIEVLERARYYAELSGGAFDPTVGPLVRLWGIGGEAPRVPAAGEIYEALSLVDWRDLLIDRPAGTVFLRRPGQALDLGAAAKGYAADRAAAILRDRAVDRALIDLGGNSLALGERQGGESWRIGVQDPLGERGDYLGILRVKDKSVVTSGVYERYFEEGGLRYHHILSTADGYPVRNGLLSATIIADRSIDADALSTTVFALGLERGLALVESRPHTEAVFVCEDRTVVLSSGAPFTLEGGGYRLAPPARGIIPLPE